MHFLKIALATIIFTFMLDMIWLGYLAKPFYHESLDMLLRKSNGIFAPNWIAALLVYMAIVAGILFFALPRANGSALSGLLWGGFFGLILYGVYDFTNYSILSGWPLNTTLVDCLWGTFLCGTSTAFACLIGNWISR